ncbi:VapC toxin family PIN domain ribonuclease [Halobacteriales archaeon QS_6_64_34]|nr:MAG: VapC toxin family PIN domain ribonuclease [Halobacteriales archaeon QS_6_64_34]
MARVVVDANVLIAARLARDQNHDRANPISQAIDTGTLPTGVVLSDVLEEVSNYLQARAGHETATVTLDALIESSGFVIEHTPKTDFDTGRSLFRRYDSLSLTDAIIVAAMQRLDIDYLYSFDDGFDSVGSIHRLTTAENPYGE